MPRDPDFRALFEALPGPHLVLAPDFDIVAVNEAYVATTRRAREELVGRSVFEAFPEAPGGSTMKNLRLSLERVLAHRAPDTMAVQRYDLPAQDGGPVEERFWSPANSPVLGPGGEVEWIIHRVTDVTDYVRLGRARGREAASDEAVEEARREVFLRAQELQEANTRLSRAHVDIARLDATRRRALEAALESVEAARVRSERAESALAQKDAELRQAHKLEAVGRLAGGIAHDFNNLLTAILGYCDLLLLGLEDAVRREEVVEIQRAGKRAAALVQQLLAFSRKQVLQPRVLDLGAVVGDLEPMLRRLVPESIDLTVARAPGVGRACADPTQLEQVILNLVVNARDAMPRGGRLTIALANADLDERFAAEHVDVTPGPHVLLAVADTGPGLSPEALAHLFEPFFTTKEPGKGTGLGLSTVYGIVKQSGGHVEASSQPGHGTTFKIYLPRVDAPPASLPASRPPAKAASGHETILVVEDDPALRKLTTLVLRGSGYSVLVAKDGPEAARLSEEHAGAIDLLVTDVILPGPSGPEIHEDLARRRPGLGVLYVSGYTPDAILPPGAVEGGAAFVQKPYTSAGLVREVRAVLDRAARERAGTPGRSSHALAP